ncbi:MAG: hypothetical protein H0X34_18795, partial [Chthoniobacterales bacterium]|nr:hypothetical protein [Chthoniobacterales bacterium]
MNNTNNILDFVSELNQGSAAQPATRRVVFAQCAREGSKVAAAALLPLAAAGCALVGKAVAPDTGLAKQVLEFAILLEEL